MFVLFMATTLVNCAKRGSGPTGGPKDTIPPVFIKATPPNFSTNFEGSEVKIYFDEFIKLKDVQKQLIISPPVKTFISPQGTASKNITIEILDTLDASTTYVFNFGLSITDNNEGNPFSAFKYVMSTGDYIDSLSVKGTIIDAVKAEPDNFVTVMLYEVDSTFSDSIVYKDSPRYVTNTLDSLTTFELDYLKEGTYKLIAMKDEDANFTFQPKKDKIGFVEEYITVPTDSSYTIKLFSEELDYKVSRPRHEAQGRIAFGVTGNADSLNIELISDVRDNIESRVTKKTADTLYYWYKPRIEQDSLIFSVSAPNYKDTLTAKLRKPKLDSLAITSITGRFLEFDKSFKVKSNIPLDSLNEGLITVIQDSVVIPFTASIKEQNNINIDFKTKENAKYKVQFLPEAIIDFFSSKNDTLTYQTSTKERSDYGEIEVTLVNAVNFPYIAQLINAKEEVVETRYTTEDPVLSFKNLNPAIYTLRLIEDRNENTVFDTGNYLRKLQPEKVINYPVPLEVRPSWTVKERFELNTISKPEAVIEEE